MAKSLGTDESVRSVHAESPLPTSLVSKAAINTAAKYPRNALTLSFPTKARDAMTAEPTNAQKPFAMMPSSPLNLAARREQRDLLAELKPKEVGSNLA